MTSIPHSLGVTALLGLLSALAGWHMVPSTLGQRPLTAETASRAVFADGTDWTNRTDGTDKTEWTQTSVLQPSAPVTLAAVPKVPLQVKAHTLFAKARAQAADGVVELDPTLPGHSVSGSGLRLQVERAHLPSSGNSVPEMDVVITPETDDTNTDTAAAAWRTDDLSRFGHGFTEEELLFRAKWGWAAHDAALRLAFATASSSRKGAP